ncbi:MAG TPA: proline--tRNA ligase [Candidatus Saccharimonadia bacterium]
METSIMRMTQLFGKPSKTEGTDYDIASHRLLIQAGFVRESTAGRYFMLPLGMAVHHKISEVVRKHMNAAGAQEMVTPVLHPLELWQETNRTTTAGFELMKVKDRRGADFALGGTAEEMAVDLVRKFNLSYRDLPFHIYQFSMKFRDEMRARGGLLRVREFVMKDGYSFSTKEQFKGIYDGMRETYSAIFDELGLKTDVVAADNGYIGGEYCHEFVSPSDIGESRYFIDEQSGYAAHEDVATFTLTSPNAGEAERPLKPVHAERGKTMKDGVAHHGLEDWRQIKDVLFVDEPSNRYILAIIRGDLDVNETKLMQVAKAYGLRAATDEEVREDVGSEPGFISPVGIAKQGKQSGRAVVVVADPSLKGVKNLYGGANKKHEDLLDINYGRDFTADIEGDIAMAQPGMLSQSGGRLVEKRGIEVGNIFQLGYHYTKLMTGAEYTDAEGKRQPYYMGCYGIGIGRTMAAIVEAHHDERGIVWPDKVAPFAASVVRLGDSEAVVRAADDLVTALEAAGVSVLYDDRDASAGIKFADADLIGLPWRVTVSAKTVEQGQAELKRRSGSEVELVRLADVPAKFRG